MSTEFKSQKAALDADESLLDALGEEGYQGLYAGLTEIAIPYNLKSHERVQLRKQLCEVYGVENVIKAEALNRYWDKVTHGKGS